MIDFIIFLLYNVSTKVSPNSKKGVFEDTNFILQKKIFVRFNKFL